MAPSGTIVGTSDLHKRHFSKTRPIQQSITTPKVGWERHRHGHHGYLHFFADGRMVVSNGNTTASNLQHVYHADSDCKANYTNTRLNKRLYRDARHPRTFTSVKWNNRWLAVSDRDSHWRARWTWQVLADVQTGTEHSQDDNTQQLFAGCRIICTLGIMRISKKI